MSGKLKPVRELSGNLLTVRELSGNILCHRKGYQNLVIASSLNISISYKNIGPVICHLLKFIF